MRELRKNSDALSLQVVAEKLEVKAPDQSFDATDVTGYCDWKGGRWVATKVQGHGCCAPQF